MSKVRQWLDDNGLSSLAGVFEREQIDWDALGLLTADDLRDLGLPIGPRAKLQAALRTLRGAEATPAPLPDEATGEAASDARLGVEGERRQLTALFCDMVGFTALASRVDPEVLQRVVRQYEELCAVCIARYEGYVFQLLGDGVVAFFGYPLAHEGEAERAIRAGLQIIETLARTEVPEVGRLEARIGIATGVVVVAPGGKGAVGETMNLAARLQGIAQPGTVVVSERVHRLAGGSFAYEDLGEQSLKGIAQPVRARRVLGLGPAHNRFEAATLQGLTPLIGREQEIGWLLERWSLAQSGEGQVAVLSGEPGIGKSRILKVLHERVQAQGGRTMPLQCSPYNVNSPLWPTSHYFERALQFGREESAESRLLKLEAMVEANGRPRADVDFIASMMSIPCGDRYGHGNLTSQRRKQETLRTLADLTEAAAHQRPTLLVFEDVHWADPTTLEVVELLIERARGIPLFILLTHRPEFASRWTPGDHLSTLHLTRLSRAQAAALVARLAGGKALPTALLEQILSRTDGVPLHVEELTKAILESGQLVERDTHYDYGSDEHVVTIPATLRDSLMARLDRHRPVKEVAQIGAAIGRSFSHELLAALSPMAPAQLQAALHQLIEAGLATQRGTPPEAVYTFKHGLLQDVAYDSLLKSRRQELHGQIAHVIEVQLPQLVRSEPEVLAHHLTAAGWAEAAIPQWQSAGELALRRMALTEAISHLNQGLRLVPSLPPSPQRDRQELALRRALGVSWMAARGWSAPEARDSLLPALKLTASAASGRDVLPVYWGLFSNTLSQGRVAESEQWAQALLAQGEASADSDMLVTAHLMMTVCTFWLGELDRCSSHIEAVTALYDPQRHRAIADVINHDPLTGVGVYRAQISWMQGHADRAVAECDARDEHARQRGHVFDTGFALCAGADVFEYRGEPEAQRARVAASEKIGRESSLKVLWQVMVPLRQGAALVRAGQAAEGVALLREGLRIREAGGGFGGSNIYLQGLLAEGLALGGDVSGALRVVERQIEQIERPGWGERCHEAEIRRLEGWLFELRGDAEAAEASYRRSLAWAHTQGARAWALRTATSLARLLHGQGRTAEARALLQPLFEAFTEGHGTRDLREARGVLDRLGA